MIEREKPFALLVDDNEATCTLVTAILKPHFSVEVVNDGNHAVDKLRTRVYEVVLLDLRMPQRDGYSVLEFLEAEAPHVLRRVLVVTAALTDDEVRRAKRFGIFDIVRKPFEVDHLLARARACAGDGAEKKLDLLCASPAVLLFVADLLKQRLM